MSVVVKDVFVIDNFMLKANSSFPVRDSLAVNMRHVVDVDVG